MKTNENKLKAISTLVMVGIMVATFIIVADHDFELYAIFIGIGAILSSILLHTLMCVIADISTNVKK